MKKCFQFALLIIFMSRAVAQQTTPVITLQTPKLSTPVMMIIEPKKLVAFHMITDIPKTSGSQYTISVGPGTPATGVPLTFNYKSFDSSGSISGNKFIVPESGLYHFDVRIDVFYNVAVYHNNFQLMICRGNEILDKKKFKVMYEEDFTPDYSISLNTDLALTKGDVIYPSFLFAPGRENSVGVSHVSFSGFKMGR